MRAFIFGAGASVHVGYPLATNLARSLIEWAANHSYQRHLNWIDPEEISSVFPSLDDFEDIITQLENPQPGSRVSALHHLRRSSILAGFRNLLCDFFDSIRTNNALLYRQFAKEFVAPGDIILTLNYDVSLERELHRAGKWEITNGYGFDLGIDSLPVSPTKVLKLHGSTNWIDYLSALGPGMGTRPVILPEEFEFLEYYRIRDPQFTMGGVDRSGSMILPGRQKRFYVVTSTNPKEREQFWNSLWLQASAALREANEVVAVGYSFPIGDTRARELITSEANPNVILTVCCGNDSENIRHQFLQHGFTRVRTHLKYFDDWLAKAR